MTVWTSNLWKINIHTVFPHIVSAHVCTVTFGLMYCSFGFPNPKKNKSSFHVIWQKSGQKRLYNTHLRVTFVSDQSLFGFDLCSDEIKPKFVPKIPAGKWLSSVHCLKWWLPQYHRHLLLEWWTTLSCDLRFHQFFSFLQSDISNKRCTKRGNQMNNQLFF